jgi:hypothetical protein
VNGSLHLCIDTSPFERVPADLAVASFFSDERPLRGAAGRADWRLCGMVSELIASGRMRGSRGEAALVPAFGRLAADSVLLLGLGRRSSFRAAWTQEITTAALRRGLLLGARSLALAPPANSEGFAAQAKLFLRGAVAAVEEADASLRVILALSSAESVSGLRELERVLEAEPAPRVHLETAPQLAARGPVPTGLGAGAR